MLRELEEEGDTQLSVEETTKPKEVPPEPWKHPAM